MHSKVKLFFKQRAHARLAKLACYHCSPWTRAKSMRPLPLRSLLYRGQWAGKEVRASQPWA